MHCKACDTLIPVSWRYVQEIDKSILEDLCWHCKSTVRSSIDAAFPPDNTIEQNLELLGIFIPEHNHEETPS